MVMNIAGLIIGIIILIGGLYYLITEKNDPESKKIYGITTAVGLVIALVFVLRLWVL